MHKHGLAVARFCNQGTRAKFTASAMLNPALNPQWYPVVLVMINSPGL